MDEGPVSVWRQHRHEGGTDLEGGVRPHRAVVGVQLSAERDFRRVREPRGLPAEKRDDSGERLQPVVVLREAGRAAREHHDVLRARADLAVRRLRLC